MFCTTVKTFFFWCLWTQNRSCFSFLRKQVKLKCQAISVDFRKLTAIFIFSWRGSRQDWIDFIHVRKKSFKLLTIQKILSEVQIAFNQMVTFECGVSDPCTCETAVSVTLASPDSGLYLVFLVTFLNFCLAVLWGCRWKSNFFFFSPLIIFSHFYK